MQANNDAYLETFSEYERIAVYFLNLIFSEVDNFKSRQMSKCSSWQRRYPIPIKVEFT